MNPPKKIRLDMAVLEQGLAPSRQRARALIMAGKVRVNGQLIDKPGTSVIRGAEIFLKGNDLPYVSRGGVKLAAALAGFNLDVNGRVCLDVGASTGGFSDCLLQHGAQRVFAVDVGYGQLAWSLRQDSRVVVIERTNIRHLAAAALPCPVDLAAIDVSFISLRIVLPAVLKFLRPGAIILALIKPQFEVGKGKVGKGGVVRDPDQHREVVAGLKAFSAGQGLRCRSLMTSPILGPKGNKEFIIYLDYPGPDGQAPVPDI